MTENELRRYADELGLNVSEDVIDNFVSTLDELEQLIEVLTSSSWSITDRSTEKDYWKPNDQSDPYGAFLTRCSISPTGTGHLDGMDFAVKDNIAVAGIPMTLGSEHFEEFVPGTTATVVRRMLNSGGHLVGKTNMDSFAYGGEQETMRFRLAKNPHDPDLMPGFTSSGSAIAIAEGLADVALGTDTGGSVRFPAAWCGVVGLKPTRGLVSHYGLGQFSKSLDAIGPLGRTTESVAKGLTAISGEDPRDSLTAGAVCEDYLGAVESVDPSELTVGCPRFAWDESVVDRNLLAAVRESLGELESLGAEVSMVEISGIDLAIPSWLIIALTEFGKYFSDNALNVGYPLYPNNDISDAFRELQEPIELTEQIAESLVLAEYLSDKYGQRHYGLAQQGRHVFSNSVEEVLDDLDVLAMPTTTTLPRSWENDIEATDTAYNTAPFNLSGHPAINVPCGSIDELPVGVQFVGKKFKEATVLQAAACMETVYS